MGVVYLEESAGVVKRRTHLNVIPKTDSNRRKYILDLTGGVSFTYELNSTTGKYEINSIDLKEATQPYIFTIPSSVLNASIDPISGDVTIASGYNGGNLTVTLEPLYDGTYYITKTGTAITAVITNPQPSVVTTKVLTGAEYDIVYNNITNNMSADAHNNVSYTKFELIKHYDNNTDETISGYTNVKNAITGFTATPQHCSINTSGQISIPENTSTTNTVAFSVVFSAGTYTENGVTVSVTSEIIEGTLQRKTESARYLTNLLYEYLSSNGTLIPKVKDSTDAEGSTYKPYNEYLSASNKEEYTFTLSHEAGHTPSLDPLSIDLNTGIITCADLATIESNLLGGDLLYDTFIWRGANSVHMFQANITATSTLNSEHNIQYTLDPETGDSSNFKLDNLVGSTTGWTSQSISTLTGQRGVSDSNTHGTTSVTRSGGTKEIHFVKLANCTKDQLIRFSFSGANTSIYVLEQLGDAIDFELETTTVINLLWLFNDTAKRDGWVAIYKVKGTNVASLKTNVFIFNQTSTQISVKLPPTN